MLRERDRMKGKADRTGTQTVLKTGKQTNTQTDGQREWSTSIVSRERDRMKGKAKKTQTHGQ